MNWKGHVILGLIMGLPFVSSPEQIFLIMSGALYPDLDHGVKEDIVERGLYFAGFIIFISLLSYFFKPEYFNIGIFIGGVLLFLLLFVPYKAEHRGITHTIIWMVISTVVLGYLMSGLSILSPTIAGLIILIMVTDSNILGKIIPIGVFLYIPIYFLLSFNLQIATFEGIWKYIIPIGIGYLSHIVGDCLTPAGCRALYPFNNYKFHNIEGYIFITLWFFAVIYLVLNRINII